MPIYEYKCTNPRCEQAYQSWARGAEKGVTCHCGSKLKRVFGFNVKNSMPDHFNVSTGTYVTGERQLKDEFKRLSDEATARTGVAHNFVPVDPQDKETLGVTEEGLDATHDHMVRSGQRDATSPRKVIQLP